MPEMQPSMQSAAMPVALDPAPSFEDFDFALGCECANPALQIERWEESRSGGESN